MSLVATSAYSGWLRRLVPVFVPVYDYVLMTEPLSAAQRGRDRLARPRGHVGRRQPVPLLPPDRRRPDPVGRLRRRSTTPATASSPEHDRRPATFEKLARNFRTPSRSSTGSASRTAGAGRSTRPRGSPSPSARRWAGACTTRWATPAWAWAPAAGRPAILRDMVLRPDSPLLRPAVRAVPPAADPAGAAPDAGRRADAPRGHRRGRPTRAVASCSCARWTPWGSASTADRAAPIARRPGTLRAGRTQSGSSRASVASGSDPWPISSSWKRSQVERGRRRGPRARGAGGGSRASRSCTCSAWPGQTM